MCLAIPGRVVEVDAELHSATIDVFGSLRRVQTHLLPDGPPKPGDWVMSHLTFAIEVLPPESVAETLEIFRQLVPGDHAALAREQVD